MTPTPRGVAVSAHGWGWRHAGRSRWAVRDLDLTVQPGQRMLVLGPSGAGKSTLLSGVAGLLGGSEDGDQEGRLLVDGQPADQKRAGIGMVLQNPDAQVIMSRVGDDVAFGMENHRVPRDRIWPRVRHALASVGLPLPLTRDTARLSGGQQQRMALAGVLAMQPGLILLDEPTANLDPAGVLEVRDAVVATAEQTGATVMVIEHRTSVWLPVVDRVIVLGADGAVVADGPAGPTVERERDRLTAAGVWVPGTALPEIPRHRTAGEPLLTATALSLGHPTGPRLDTHLDLSVPAASTTVVTGPNGAGKTTLALTLGGLLAPRGGRLTASAALAPAPQRTEPARWRSRELLTRIGSVFQNPEHQFLTASVYDELAVGPRALRRDDATVAAIVDELLDRLGLTALATANPYTLSGGEKRRLSVATVLATTPSVMVLDEPTFGQDRTTWIELVRLLAEVTDQGTAVVAITHDRDFVDVLADQHIDLPAWHPDRTAEPSR